MNIASDLIISTDDLAEEEFKLIYSTLNIKNDLEKYLYNSIPEINQILEKNLLK